jgi:hypothetical protein
MMACHVYDPKYYKFMTIAVYIMQFENTKTQQIMWSKLNRTMFKHKYVEPDFKGFMENNAHAN